MNQPDLFSEVPVSRRSAPSTSHEAEEHITQSGKRAAHQHIIASAVKTYVGYTAVELHWELRREGHKISLNSVRSRLTEMKDIKVKQGDKRECSIHGMRMVTWYPI